MRFALAVAVLMGGCAGPEAEWVGEWDVFLDEARTPCGGGASSDVDGSVLWRIESSPERGLFIAGECSISLRALTASYAEFRVSTCSTSLDDGTPVELTINGGSLTMDPDRLGFTGSLSGRTEAPGVCFDVRDEIVATRR